MIIKALCYIPDSPWTFLDILRLWVPSRQLCADAYTMFHAPLVILRLQAPSGQHHIMQIHTLKSPILTFTIWQTFLHLSFCYPESLIIYLTLCPYHTIPDQHFAQIGTLPTPPYLSPWPAACYHSLHASSRTVYYHILIVFMLNFNVVQVPYFAWSVMLAEACWVRDSNFNCQIGSVACNTCHHELLCSST